MDTPRRDFFQQMLAAGALTTGAGILSACASASASGAAPGAVKPLAQTGEWDMSWRGKLGKYKTAYDAPEIMNGAALAFASSAAEGYKDAFGAEHDFTPVLILRHAASVMVLNDAMWDTIGIGTSRTLKDPTTGEPAKRNPFINYTKGDKFSMIGADSGIDVLMSKGAVVMACNRALAGAAYQLKQKKPELTQAQAHAEIRKNVIPGVYVMPNGIFAVAAAQDAGCNYMRVV
jgi:hypothetical protein